MSAAGPEVPTGPAGPAGLAGEPRAWGWVMALRAGSTTPWHEWRLSGADGDRADRYLPGAQQLELLRRLNLAGVPDRVLVDRVVSASAPGRGTPDLELLGAVQPPRWGPRPVDPVDLPDAELVRVATMLLAEDVVSGEGPTTPHTRRRPWARHYRLVGDPWLADPLRAQLARIGRPAGGRRAPVYVLGTDVATMVVHAFTARAFDEGGSAWSSWLGANPARPMPPRVDLVGAARFWAERIGRSRVRFVLDPDHLPRALGVRRRLTQTPDLSADAVDLARRVAAPLGLLVLPDERARLLRARLLPRLARHPGPPLRLPVSHHEWAVRRAERIRAVVRTEGYPVIGGQANLDRLVPRVIEAPEPDEGPTDAGVLALAVRLLLESTAGSMGTAGMKGTEG